MTTENLLTTFVAIVFVSVFVFFAYQAIKNGGIRGAVLGGNIKRTVGQVEPTFTIVGKTILRINQLESTGKYVAVGIEVVSKTMLSYNLQGFSLTKAEAAKLAGLLLEAAEQDI